MLRTYQSNASLGKPKREQSYKSFKPAKTRSEQQKAFQGPFVLGFSYFTSGIMLSPGIFATVLVHFLCTSKMSQGLLSPQHVLAVHGHLCELTERKCIRIKKYTIEILFSVLFLVLFLFFILRRKRYCQHKHFPHSHSCHTTWQSSHSHLSY